MRRLATGALASLIFAASSARADEPTIVVEPPPEAVPAPAPPPSPPKSPSYKWQPNSTMLTAGTAIFLAGYGPAFALGAPSTVGLAGRIVILVFTIGVECWNLDGENPNHSYLCEADHGASVLLVPVAGPLIFADTHPHDTFINRNGSEMSPTSKALLYTSSVTQAVGASVMITSFALGHDTPAEPPRPGPNRSLLMAGLLTFGAAYGEAFVLSTPSLGVVAFEALSLTSSNAQNEKKEPIAAAELAIPLAGPFLFAGTNGRDIAMNPNGSLSQTARVLLFADGAAQLVGGVMMLAALADSRPSPSDVAQPSIGPKTRILPMLGAGTFGLTLSMSGW